MLPGLSSCILKYASDRAETQPLECKDNEKRLENKSFPTVIHGLSTSHT